MPKKKKPHADEKIKSYLREIGKRGGLAGSQKSKSDAGKASAAKRWGTKPKKESEEESK
jgi:hypothetical protein